MHVVTECAKLVVRRPRRALRRCRRPARHPPLRGVLGRATRARGRGRLGGVPAGFRSAPARARRAGRRGLRRAEPRHRAPRRRRPLRQHALRDAERGLAPELAGDPVARLAARNPRADVLARGRAAIVAPAGRPPADHALARAGAARREAVPRLGNARRRPAGAVGAARVPAPRRPRARSPGGDRRTRVPHRPPDLVLLPARLRSEVARARVARELARRLPISSGEVTT